MAQPHSARTDAKLAVVRTHLKAGRVVLLQETRWQPGEGHIREGLLRYASVAWSPARPARA
eukprot:5626323-Alexandrium_andersonii.AAC.1